jgi:flagellar hook assembly protein FlgD
VQAPEKLALFQNYPNPFNPTTTFAFELPSAADVRLIIYNQKGQIVRELVNGEMAPGYHTVAWDARDSNGIQAPTGIYLYRLTAGDFSETKKLTLLK